MPKQLNFLTLRDRDGTQFIDLQLRPDELRAIGHVTTQWAFMEFLILRDSKGLAEHLGIPLPKDAEAVSFRKRKKAWEDLARKALKNFDEELSRTLQLIKEIGEVAHERHKLTHDAIEYEPQNPNRLKAFPREMMGKFGWPLDTAKIEKTARKIARINYGLLSIHKDPEIAHGASRRK